MSKRDKHNRFMDAPDFQELEKMVTEKPLPVSGQTVKDVSVSTGLDEDNDDDSSYFDFGKVKTFAVACWSKTYYGCRFPITWTWNIAKTLGKKIAPYCVIHWEDSERKNKELEFPKTDAVKTGTVKPAVNDDEDDFEKPSRWWNIGIKSAAVAAALLVLLGGYFTAKTFFNKPHEEVADNLLEVVSSEIGTPKEEPKQEGQKIAAAPKQPAPTFPELPTPSKSEPSKDVKPIESDIANDPFPNIPTPPVAAASSLADPFGSALNTAETPESVFAEKKEEVAVEKIAEKKPEKAVEEKIEVAESKPVEKLTPLQPLEPMQPSAAPALQPLAALDSPAVPIDSATAPLTKESSVYLRTASNYGEANNSRKANSRFSQAPTPPAVTSTIPQTTVKQTVPIIESVKEIVPKIPYTGSVQTIAPPIVPPPVATAATVQTTPKPMAATLNTETAPAIPKDQATTTASIPTVMANVVSMEMKTSQTLPMGTQLREQVQELRFGTAKTAEPALRFTPHRSAQAYVAEPMAENNSLAALLPGKDLNPDSDDIAKALPALESAPRAIVAEINPAYRTIAPDTKPVALSSDSAMTDEKGMTFSERVGSSVQRSPSATETYVVQEGDTYMTISDKFYGTSLLYTALAAHNRKLGIGWRPADGAVIEIPTAAFLQANYEQHRLERRLDSQRSAIRYTIQEGDTIFRLATDKLHDSTRWREIYAMNSDRIQDVRDLKPGLEILLPTRN